MKSKQLDINAHGPANLFSLNSEISNFIAETDLVSGQVFAFSVGSTAAIVAPSEKDAFTDWVASFLPFNQSSHHPGNAFSHLRSTLLGSDISLSVEGKRLKTPQDVCLLENTEGMKERPIELRAYGEFLGGGRLNMKVASNTLPVKSNGWIDAIDLTQIAGDVILESGIIDGFLQIETLAKDSAISTSEYESALISDTVDFMSEMVADVEEEFKGAIASAVIGSSMNFPIKDGKLKTGVWQQPIFVDFGKSGDKEIFFQAVGL